MVKRLFLFLLLSGGWLPAFSAPARADEHLHEADVIIYGGTSAGIAAAVQTSRMGKTAILIEPGNHLGGLTSGGLGWTDSGRKEAIGGISKEFYRRVHQHYSQPEAWKFEEPGDLNQKRGKGIYDPKADAIWVFEPHVAEKIYEEMLADCGDAVTVVKQQRLNRETGVKRDGQRITEIAMESGERFQGKIFIDATYEGDLMAAAGVDFHVGRESNETYGETINGVQKEKNTHLHRFVVKVDPYVKPGDPSSGVLPGINAGDPGEEGAGDHRVQAYCFRMCMSRVPENRIPFPKPEGYDEQRYELLLRNYEAGDLRLPLKPDMMPNGKTDTNNNCAVSTDNIGMNYDYPEASYAEREKIIQEHVTYQQGLMWTLANHPRVPEKIRKEMSQWGLSKDEFQDTGGWGHQPYIREARRMIGDYVMTELDCRRIRICEDSIGLGSYNMDSHNCQRYITEEGFVQNEGDIQISPGGPYAISYRSIIPKKGQAENLLVPAAMSASHIAYGSIRMEPVFMVLGHSAATAGVFAIDDGITVQDVSYEKLRKKLLEDGQALDLPPDAKPHRVIDIAKMPGVVIDDAQAELTGDWKTSTSGRPFLGSGYRHDDNAGQGAKSAIFTAKLPKAGRYEVRISYPPNPNRAGNVPVTIATAAGSKTATVDQKKSPEHDDLFTTVGIFEFEAGETTVTISNEKANGHVIVDGVQWLPAK